MERHSAHNFIGFNPSVATFLVIGLDSIGCYVGKVLSDRFGHTEVTIATMTMSGLCAATIVFTFSASPDITLLVAILWGLAINSDSAQFSTSVTKLSEPAYDDTALTMQACVGFAVTTISIWIIAPLVKAMVWRWAFSILAIGPICGVSAMSRLRELPESP